MTSVPTPDPSDAVVLDELHRLGRAEQITAIRRLSGGTQADVWLITYADGTRVVGKTDLSMLWGCPQPPAADRFFERYQELNPSPPGCPDRMPVLHLRELLSVIAAYGPTATVSINQTRDILTPFYAR
jgi:hypothetical protein